MKLSLKLVNLLQYQNIKTFLRKAMFQISLKKFLWQKNKNNVPRRYVISDLNGEEILGTFYKKQIKKSLELKK